MDTYRPRVLPKPAAAKKKASKQDAKAKTADDFAFGAGAAGVVRADKRGATQLRPTCEFTQSKL